MLAETREQLRELFDRYVCGDSDIAGHLDLLHRFAIGSVLEIGVRDGISTTALLLGVVEHGGHLYSIDVEDCSRHFQGHPQWTFIHSDSKDVERIYANIPSRLDLLFIDGDHSEEGAYADLYNYGHRAKVIAVHDTSAPNFPGVRSAVERYHRECGKNCLHYYKHCFGLAVMV